MAQVQETAYPTRSRSVADVRPSRFLIRTGNFFKKVSQFRGNRKKSMSDAADSTHEAAVFASRPMGLGHKSFGFSQPILGVANHRRTTSDLEDDSDASLPGTASPRSSSAHRMSSPPATIAADTVVPSLINGSNAQDSRSSTQRGPKNPPPASPTSTSSPAGLSPTTAPTSSSLYPPSSVAVKRPSGELTELDGLPRSSEPSWLPSSSPQPQLQSQPQAKLQSSPIPQTSTPNLNNRRVVIAPDVRTQTKSQTHYTQSLPARTLSLPTVAAPPTPSPLSSSPLQSQTQTIPFTSPSIASPSPSPSPFSSPSTSAMQTPKARPSTATSTISDIESIARERNLHLRLASLPPPMMARYNAEGSARLTPSIILPRQMPIPILNLPTLPLPTSPLTQDHGNHDSHNDNHHGNGSGPREGRGLGMPLRSIPALPLNGPRDDENPDMDDEASDSEDEGEEGDDDMHSHRRRDEGVSDDEDMDGEGDEGSTASVSASTVRAGLPQVDTSPLGISISFSGNNPLRIQTRVGRGGQGNERPDTLYFTPTLEVHPSPRFPPPPPMPSSSREGTPVSIDYFSSKRREAHQGVEEVIRTPRPSDFASTSSSAQQPVAGPSTMTSPQQVVRPPSGNVSGPGMIPRIVPMPPPTPASPLPPSFSRRQSATSNSIKAGKRPSTSIASPTAMEQSNLLRPSLYHQTSKSMVDLMSYSRKEKEKEDENNNTGVVGAGKRNSRLQEVSIIVEGTVQGDYLEVPKSPTPGLRRQRSLPTYTLATQPPPYPSFLPPHHPHQQPHNILPREEEGREDLPPYANSILLIAMMPRKMEFTAPGVQALERKWRRVIVVLEGTILRVYRCHGAGSGGKGGKIGEWWEWAVGAGDCSTGEGVGGAKGSQGGVRVSAIRERERRVQGNENGNAGLGSPRLKGEGEDGEGEREQQQTQTSPQVQPTLPTTTSKSKFHLPAGLLHPSRSSQGNLSSSRLGLPTSSTNASRSRLSFDTPRERASSIATSSRRSMDALSNSSSSRLLSGSRASANTRDSPETVISVVSRTSPSSNSLLSPTSLNPNASSYINTTSPSHTTSSSPISRSPSSAHGSSLSVSSSSDSKQKLAIPDAKDLIHTYTLQHAESGLASDYLKRKNVIRVRMEGEQFLLQARDVSMVIDWIEGIQAATSIALDLDERPMPKGPMFPRRRRRRQRRTEASTSQALETTALRTTTAISGSAS